MAKRKYRERYYDLPEEDLQDKIALAKKGDGLAQMELLEIFDNFLSKYVTLLHYSRFNITDYDVRRFLALFVKDPTVRYPLLRNSLSAAQQREVNEVVRGIQYMVQRYGEEEDTRQTVSMTFLQCVERYQRKGDIPFSGYLYSYFFYLLKKNVTVFLIDQLGRKSFPLLADDDSEDWGEGDERPQGFAPPPAPSVEDLIHGEEIDEYWVIGDTCHPPFDVLTIQERQLIKWRYINGEKSADVSARITEHTNTSREAFSRIRKKLRDAMQEVVF